MLGSVGPCAKQNEGFAGPSVSLFRQSRVATALIRTVSDGWRSRFEAGEQPLGNEVAQGDPEATAHDGLALATPLSLTVNFPLGAPLKVPLVIHSMTAAVGRQGSISRQLRNEGPIQRYGANQVQTSGPRPNDRPHRWVSLRPVRSQSAADLSQAFGNQQNQQPDQRVRSNAITA